MNHVDRRAAAWNALTDQVDASAFLVTGEANVRYLTGFTGSNGCVLLSAHGAVLGTDGRYVVQAGEECPDLALHIDRDTVPSLISQWSAESSGPLAVEGDHLSMTAFTRIAQIVGEARPPVALVGIVESLRIVKDASEVALLSQACRISDEALAATLPRIRVGMTERDVARMLEAHMWECGADGISFETIVAAGPMSAVPHHRPDERTLVLGDLVVIDFGAEVGGYHADQTRTFVMGEPHEWQRDLHALVLAAQEAGRAAVCAGASLPDVDAASRGVIEAAEHGNEFVHGLGHGVGLEIHEAPMIGPRATGILAAGSLVTVEPGVYLPERGGVRIEDTVAVTEGPCICLTATDRGLQILG